MFTGIVGCHPPDGEDLIIADLTWIDSYGIFVFLVSSQCVQAHVSVRVFDLAYKYSKPIKQLFTSKQSMHTPLVIL